MKRTLNGITEPVAFKAPIKIGNGDVIYSTHKGNYECVTEQVNGKRIKIKLHNILVIPNATHNLFIQNAALSRGATISNEGLITKFTVGNDVIKFDHCLYGGSGFLSAIKLINTKFKSVEDYNMVSSNFNVSNILEDNYNKIVNVNTLHGMFVHANQEATKATAKYYSYHPVGKLNVCADCAIAKAKQKKYQEIH